MKLVVKSRVRQPSPNLFVIKKSVVEPFYAKRHGKISRITGWLLPERSYKPNEQGVMNFISDHLGLDRYNSLVEKESKSSDYVVEAVNNILLEVTDSGKEDLARMMRANKTSVKQLMSVLFDRISSDVGKQGISLKVMEKIPKAESEKESYGSISLDKIKLEREMVLVDTRNPQNIIDASELKKANLEKGKKIYVPASLRRRAYYRYDPRTKTEEEKERVFWHGSPSGELAGKYGIHIGTFEAAREALEARIGVPVEGDWDGTREYGKTLLAGKKTLEKMQKETGHYYDTGHNANAPEEDYYPTQRKEKAKYSDGIEVLMDNKPTLMPVRIKGKMTNTSGHPMSDDQANITMMKLSKQGKARRGYYYRNIGEDEESISAVVPNKEHLEILKSLEKADVYVKPFTRMRRGHLEMVGAHRRTKTLSEIREEIKRDRKTAAKKLGVDEKELKYSGIQQGYSDVKAEKVDQYIHLWTILKPGHPEDQSTKSSGVKYQLPDKIEKTGETKINFVQPERTKRREIVVWIDVDAFDKEWSKDKDFYIEKGGTGKTIGNRYENFKEFLKTGDPVEMPEVSSRPPAWPGVERSLVGFTNGRHRFAVLRDMGLKRIPVSISHLDLPFFKEHFGGTTERKSGKFVYEPVDLKASVAKARLNEFGQKYR